ncbi:MAG: aldehyde dehydrogenase family protein [Sandaracinaceae bacterium]|nr:aldehyde dehydrogenase family protein [Sandaracinaceae bacterium]
MATKAQCDIVARHVDDAKAQGATVLTGGEKVDRPGLWYAPTVLEGMPAGSTVMTEETFGPILPIVEVDSEEDAIKAANSTRYGLTASVWTKNLAQGERIARRLKAGVVTVNNHSFTGAIPSLPWTGVGESGYGITNSTHAMDLLTRPRAMLIDSSKAARELWWYPYTPALSIIAKSMIELRRGGSGIPSKIRAVTSLIPAMMKRFK